jgi:glycosyltransferase involved in cell wall biosynthesis
MPTIICCLLMVRNERDRITVTLNSTREVVQSYIVYDTGSNDDTIDIIRRWCLENKKQFRFFEGIFVDFSTSRNALLDYADQFYDHDYDLLLDSSDELRNGSKLLEFCNSYDGPCSGYLVKQEWYFGISTQSYYNVRLIKPHHNWRYKCPVHEYLNSPETDDTPVHTGIKPKKLTDIIIYQDRTADGGKSVPRFSRDREILFKEIKKNPNDSRSMFYLAQTFACLGQLHESFKHYKKRTQMMEGFHEEAFQAFLKCGDISRTIGFSDEETTMWYIKAYSFLPRAEPLVNVAYLNLNMNPPRYYVAYLFLKMASLLNFPPEDILFIDKDAYDYRRWQLFSVTSWFLGKDAVSRGKPVTNVFLREGAEACKIAISAKDRRIDKENMKCYEDVFLGKPIELVKDPEIEII